MTYDPPIATGLQPVSVRIRSLGGEVKDGITAPYFCTLSGILKFDASTEAPNCVYDEMVAMRLGICVGAPVASGALVVAERGEGFVSLMVGARNFRLPDLDQEFWADAATAFPNHAALLLAFDIFIGNGDRRSNIKADIKRKNLQFLRGSITAIAFWMRFLMSRRASNASLPAILSSKSTRSSRFPVWLVSAWVITSTGFPICLTIRLSVLAYLARCSDASLWISRNA